jgi:uncharacterized protein (DUF2147 family)
MKKLYVLATLLMASTTAAHAGNSVSFEIEGQKIHIEAPKNCDSLSCIKISTPGMSGSGFNLKGFKGFKGLGNNEDDDDDTADNSNPPPAQATAPAPVAQAPAPQPAAPVMNSAATVPTTVASTAPVTPAAVPVANTVAPVTAAPVAAAAPAPIAAPAPVAQTPAPVTPLGVWATEDNKGNVRIEQCGTNLCGYADNTGEKILISMKPTGSKWSGQIHDPDSGRDYDSTIALKGANALKVQGCAFGGLFCGGQTWKRVS